MTQPDREAENHPATPSDAPEIFWTPQIKLLVAINIVFVIIIVLGLITVMHALRPLGGHLADYLTK